MDHVVRARDAARDALADIEPAPLRDLLRERLADASMTPGVLTLVSTRALDPTADLDAVAEHAAGVQLIYEGLRLTRTLTHDEPWARVDTDSAVDADLDVLAADVFVSRGFYLLARTEVADRAVDVVRAFGRDQTRRRAPDADADALDRRLECDVFTLAVAAGAAAAGVAAGDDLLAYAADLVPTLDDGSLPPTDAALPETVGDRIATLAGDAPSATDG
ncbi:MAG: hypothetical protein ABEJ82_09005 [Haloplanus sp.]